MIYLTLYQALFFGGGVIKNIKFQKCLQIDWGHVKKAIIIKRPMRVSVILGS